jgi:hypothetical protein
LNEEGKPAKYHRALDTMLNNAHDPAAEIVEAATSSAAQCTRTRREHNEEVKALFERRRQEPDPLERKMLSKQLWKALRRQRRQRTDEEIRHVAERGAGLNKLRRTLQQQAGRDRITQVRDDDGTLHKDPGSVCEVFAKFYEELYKDELANGIGTTSNGKTIDFHMKALTFEEVEKALRGLKNGRTGSDDGLVAEMLKTAHRGLIEVLVLFFNDILQEGLDTPDSWKKVKVKVIFKKGDPELPKNYRPISIIPVLAKVYSTILYNRIKDDMDKRLAEEQYGFRRGRGCADAVHILRAIIEKSAEWGEQLWVATLDVEKAFDRVHHANLFESLVDGKVDASIIGALRRLYANMRASVV